MAVSRALSAQHDIHRDTAPASPDAHRAAAAKWRVALLVALLPLFGQTMHYMKDIPPAWALSKLFPILSLPLVLPVMTVRGPPLLRFWLCAFIYLLMMPSIIAVFTFNQNFFLGLTAQVKLLPMLYALSFFGFLLLLRPSLDELQRAFLLCGLILFAVLIALWLFAPQSWYTTEYKFGDAPLLSADDRGNRIRMPMYFGMIAIFALYRRLLARREWKVGLLFVIALVVLVAVVKTRATVLAAAATLALLSLAMASPRLRIAAGVLAAVGAIGLLQIPYVASAFDTSSSSGFDVRWITILKAIQFLGESPLRWIFGVGTITPLQPDGLSRFFNHFFFLADISWLGIVFEYGLIGSALMLGLLVHTWWFGQRVRRNVDTPVFGGLQDYVLFTILMSPLYSTMTLQPGEIAVIAATFLYGWMIVRDHERGDVRSPPASLR